MLCFVCVINRANRAVGYFGSSLKYCLTVGILNCRVVPHPPFRSTPVCPTPTVPVDTRVSHCSATGMGLIEVVWVTKAVDLDYSGKVTSSLDWAKILGEWVLQVTGLTLDKGREQVYPNPRNLARHSVRRVGIPLSVWRSAVSEPQSNPLPARHRGTSFGGRTVTSDLRLWAITD